MAIKILFLSANPSDTARLRLGFEVRAIDDALRKAEYRDIFDLRQQWATRAMDLQSYLMRHRPDIVHFSGHGSEQSQIILENNAGVGQPVPVQALGRLFSVLKDNIKCVVLNACYSEEQAKAIAEHIDCVIGMSDALGDIAAVSFAAAFYQALGFGKNVKTAFELGCVQIGLEGLDQQHIPRLVTRKGDGSDIAFSSGAKILPAPTFPQIVSPKMGSSNKTRMIILDLPDVPVTCVAGESIQIFNTLIQLHELYPISQVKACVLRGEYWAASNSRLDYGFSLIFLARDDLVGTVKKVEKTSLSYQLLDLSSPTPNDDFYRFSASVEGLSLHDIRVAFQRKTLSGTRSVFVTLRNLKLEVIYEQLE